ncbi:MAG: AmmeMemoRadiSam system protein B [Phycisphaerales bacterium]|nr:AmmeMemoRadiSam system protein B [Phycisphaerales bacterium]
MTNNEVPEHLQQPEIRRIQPIPSADSEGRPIIHLRDPFMLAKDRMLAVPMAAMQAIQLFDGKHDLEGIAKAVKRSEADILTLAENMDEAGLIWGPTCDRLESELKTDLETAGHFPMRQSRVLGDSDEAARGRIRTWINDTEDPEIEGEIKGLVVPRLDYNAMWPVYAGAYHTVRSAAIDHVLLLGCNHAGLGDGVILTRFGFESPLGVINSDNEFTNQLTEMLGNSALNNQLDHITEHGPEMQVPWIQECLGSEVPVTAALVPDPLAPVGDLDPDAISHDEFAMAARSVIENISGRTLVIAAVDLSHAGPQAGEPRPVDEQRRFDVERTDRELLGQFINGTSEGLLDEARRTNNPTRWSGLGPMTMILDILKPGQIELIDYRQMMLDQKGTAMVTDASLALT